MMLGGNEREVMLYSVAEILFSTEAPPDSQLADVLPDGVPGRKKGRSGRARSPWGSAVFFADEIPDSPMDPVTPNFDFEFD